LPQQLATTVVSDRQSLLPRVYERKEKHLGHVLLADDLSNYPAVSVSDLFRSVPRFYSILTGTKSCRDVTVYVDGLTFPPDWKLDEYIRPAEIAAIEVHGSADFVHEDFLKVSTGPADTVCSSTARSDKPRHCAASSRGELERNLR
jgi:hypothetical protein